MLNKLSTPCNGLANRIKPFTHWLFVVMSITLGTSNGVVAQIPYNFERLKCVGPVPDDFLVWFDQKFQDQKKSKQVRSDLNGRTAKKYSAFSSFTTELILRSGKTLYGDTVTQYAQEVCDYILAKNGMPLNIRVYTIRSEIVNAYSTPQGIIFLTQGLLSRISNEHQLAFVLSHEIAHYTMNHSIQKFKAFERLNKKQNKEEQVEELLLKNLQFSRETEEQADRKGYALFANCGYDNAQIYSVLDILEFAHQMPIHFDQTFLSTESIFEIKIPDHLVLTDTNFKAVDTEHENASWRSHPTIESRKREIEHAILLNPGQAKLTREVQDYSFYQSLVTFDLINSLIRLTRYFDALYLAKLLEIEYPKHQFLTRVQAQCYYGILEFLSNHQSGEYNRGWKHYKTMHPTAQPWFFFMAKMKPLEIKAFAIRQLWELRDQGLPNYNVLFNKSVLLLLEKSDIEQYVTKKRFFEDHQSALFVLGLFEPVYESELFKKSAGTIDKIISYRKSSQLVFLDGLKDSDGNEAYFNKELNDTILMLTPSVFLHDTRRNNQVNIINSKKNEQSLMQDILAITRESGLEINVINAPNVHMLTTDKMNDYSLITDWISEFRRYKGFGYSAFTQPSIDKLVDKYGTSQLALLDIWSYKLKRVWLYNYIAIFNFPDDFSVEIGPIRSTEYVFSVINLETADYDFIDFWKYRNGYRNYLVRNQIYHSIIKSKKQ